ncbi:hypothetical protein D3C76_1448000 [compost metagenome]
MRWLSPVARSASPSSVCKKRSNSSFTATTTNGINRSGDNELNIVVSPSSPTFGLPIIRMLMEYSAIIIKIPDNRPFIFPLVCSKPVIAPATKPPKKAQIVAIHGDVPPVIITAAMAPPVVKLPSTVKSGKSRMRKVM